MVVIYVVLIDSMVTANRYKFLFFLFFFVVVCVLLLQEYFSCPEPLVVQRTCTYSIFIVTYVHVWRGDQISLAETSDKLSFMSSWSILTSCGHSVCENNNVLVKTLAVPSVPFREKLKQLIEKRIGKENFVEKLGFITKHELYSRAAQKPQPVFPSPEQMLFDHEFTKLVKELEGQFFFCLPVIFHDLSWFIIIVSDVSWHLINDVCRLL